METTMFDHQNPDQHQFDAKPIFQAVNEATTVANIERNEAVGNVVGGWIIKFKNIAAKSTGFGYKVTG